MKDTPLVFSCEKCGSRIDGVSNRSGGLMVCNNCIFSEGGDSNEYEMDGKKMKMYRLRRDIDLPGMEMILKLFVQQLMDDRFRKGEHIVDTTKFLYSLTMIMKADLMSVLEALNKSSSILELDKENAVLIMNESQELLQHINDMEIKFTSLSMRMREYMLKHDTVI